MRIFEPSGRTFGSAATVPVHDFDPSADFPTIEYANAVNFLRSVFFTGVAAATRPATKKPATRNVTRVRYMNILRTAWAGTFVHVSYSRRCTSGASVARSMI